MSIRNSLTLPLNNLAWKRLAPGDTIGAVRYAQTAVQLEPSSNLFDAPLAMSCFRSQ
jgi:hypothetical protein